MKIPTIVVKRDIEFQTDLWQRCSDEGDLSGWLREVGGQLEQRQLTLKLPGEKIRNTRELLGYFRAHQGAPGALRDLTQAIDDVVKVNSAVPDETTVDLRDNSKLAKVLGLGDDVENYGLQVLDGKKIPAAKRGVVNHLISSAAELSTKAVEKTLLPLLESKVDGEGLSILQYMQRRGKLRPLLGKALGEHKGGRLGSLIAAEMWLKGRTEDSPYFGKFEDWDQKAVRLGAELDSVKSLGFEEQIEQLANTRFTDGNSVDVLINGEVAFANRYKLIEGATTSVRVASWAFYDDVTGNKMADLLSQKAREGLEVQVIVDGQVAAHEGHHEMFDRMREAGVQVVGFRDPARPYDGNHRKILTVDGVHAQVGGQNMGDFYSRDGDPHGPKFRDTDLYIQGPAAAETDRLFTSLWNSQIAARSSLADGDPLKLNDAPIDASKIPDTQPGPKGERVAVINHVPGSDENIIKAYLAGIRGASKSIDIEQAYFLKMAPIHEALMDALERGVQLRVLTNGKQSFDEPEVSGPCVDALWELEEAGAEIYLKQGDPTHGLGADQDMVHSKFMIVDGRDPEPGTPVYSYVGSYNLHPRSYQLEGEDVVVTKSDPAATEQNTARDLGAAFEKDVAAARRATSPELQEEADQFIGKVLNLLFNQL